MVVTRGVFAFNRRPHDARALSGVAQCFFDTAMVLNLLLAVLKTVGNGEPSRFRPTGSPQMGQRRATGWLWRCCAWTWRLASWPLQLQAGQRYLRETRIDTPATVILAIGPAAVKATGYFHGYTMPSATIAASHPAWKQSAVLLAATAARTAWAGHRQRRQPGTRWQPSTSSGSSVQQLRSRSDAPQAVALALVAKWTHHGAPFMASGTIRRADSMRS